MGRRFSIPLETLLVGWALLIPTPSQATGCGELQSAVISADGVDLAARSAALAAPTLRRALKVAMAVSASNPLSPTLPDSWVDYECYARVIHKVELWAVGISNRESPGEAVVDADLSRLRGGSCQTYRSAMQDLLASQRREKDQLQRRSEELDRLKKSLDRLVENLHSLSRILRDIPLESAAFTALDLDWLSADASQATRALEAARNTTRKRTEELQRAADATSHALQVTFAQAACEAAELASTMADTQEKTNALETVDRHHERSMAQQSLENDMSAARTLGRSTAQPDFQKNLASEGEAPVDSSESDQGPRDAYGPSQACRQASERLRSLHTQCWTGSGSSALGICEAARLGFDCMQGAEHLAAGCPEAIASAREYQAFYRRQAEEACSGIR